MGLSVKSEAPDNSSDRRCRDLERPLHMCGRTVCCGGKGSFAAVPVNGGGNRRKRPFADPDRTAGIDPSREAAREDGLRSRSPDTARRATPPAEAAKRDHTADQSTAAGAAETPTDTAKSTAAWPAEYRANYRDFMG